MTRQWGANATGERRRGKVAKAKEKTHSKNKHASSDRQQVQPDICFLPKKQGAQINANQYSAVGAGARGDNACTHTIYICIWIQYTFVVVFMYNIHAYVCIYNSSWLHHLPQQCQLNSTKQRVPEFAYLHAQTTCDPQIILECASFSSSSSSVPSIPLFRRIHLKRYFFSEILKSKQNRESTMRRERRKFVLTKDKALVRPSVLSTHTPHSYTRLVG